MMGLDEHNSAMLARRTPKSCKSFHNRFLRSRDLFAYASLTVLMAMGMGCARSTPSGLWPEKAPRDTVLAPGDQLLIIHYSHPEMNRQDAERSPIIVRPDGKISLQLLDDVQAAGLTLQELDETLVGLYAKHLIDPVLTVEIRSFQEQRVFVAGEVLRPGVVPMPGRLTALEAIIEAGGYNLKTGTPNSVVVIRAQEGKRHVKKIYLNMDSTREGKIWTEEFYLQPRDIVFVERHWMQKVTDFLVRYVGGLLPFPIPIPLA